MIPFSCTSSTSSAMSCLFSGTESSSGAATRSARLPEWRLPLVPRYSDAIQPLRQSCGGQCSEGSAQLITYFILRAYSVHSLLRWRTRKVLLSRSESSNSAWHLSIGPANLDRTRKDKWRKPEGKEHEASQPMLLLIILITIMILIMIFSSHIFIITQTDANKLFLWRHNLGLKKPINCQYGNIFHMEISHWDKAIAILSYRH